MHHLGLLHHHALGRHVGRLPFTTRRAMREQKARKRAQKIVARKRKRPLMTVKFSTIDSTLPFPDDWMTYD